MNPDLSSIPDQPMRPASTTESSTSATNVLLAYDGSSHAQAAVQLVKSTFGNCTAPGASEEDRPACRLTAITVLPTQSISNHERLQASLDQAMQSFQEAELKVEAILKAGHPAASINSYAQEINADLIIIGAQGLRSALGILLGGVAQQVVEYAHCPVLVVRAPFNGIRRVLVADDGSPYSQKAIEYLAPPCMGAESPASARRCSWLPPAAAITVMHVLPPPIPYEVAARAYTLGPEVVYAAPTEPLDVVAIMADEERQGRRILQEAEAVFAAAGIGIQTQMVRGDAAAELIQYTKDQATDLVICGSRGLSGISGWLVGSVSRKLVHYSGCSVLIVK